MTEETASRYLKILEEELLTAMGCTEPAAVAYCAAVARKALGALPERAEISVSGNILKNVKSAAVPNTAGLRGVSAAAAAGIVAGDPAKKLEILSDITDADRERIAVFLTHVPISVRKAERGCVFDIGVRLFAEGGSAFARIEGDHTNLVYVERNGEAVLSGQLSAEKPQCRAMTVKEIVEFADCVSPALLEPLVGRQIALNTAIAEEGLRGEYGARIGRVLLSAYGDSVYIRAKATAAAGSDARMNGCSLPVVIVSGSGNQGMTASLPVAVYAKHLGASRETLLRAVALSDLITIHLKSGVGKLSAYCGAVSAGVGAGAGVAYLHGGKFDEVAHTVVNALAIASGIVCDGAKSSCAAKIASAVDAGLLGFEMYRSGSEFYGGDGLLAKSVEETIANFGDLARIGMRETDEEIIRMMLADR